MSVGESVELSKSIEALQDRLTILDKQRYVDCFPVSVIGR
jgi:hypothetical protein